MGAVGSGGLVAGIDVGTHSCLMVVGRARSGRLEVVEDHCEVPALGTGLARTGRLDERAVERTLAVLGAYADRARELGVGRLRAVGTAALRQAANPGLLVDAARERFGLEVEVIAPEEEARLASLAAAEPGGPGAWVVDVGGGSTEVAGPGGMPRASAPVGAVLLTEAHGTSGESGGASPEAIEGLLAAARAGLAEGWGELLGAAPCPGSAGVVLVAVGGTAVNLACLVAGLEAFDHAAVEGHRVPSGAALEQARRLAGLPLEERLGLPLEAARAAVLPAGLACLAAGEEALGSLELLVTTRGLRHGLARRILGLV